MLSKLREAALRYDLGATLWRIGVTRDGKNELRDLTVQQLEWLVLRYPDWSDQHKWIQNLIAQKKANP